MTSATAKEFLDLYAQLRQECINKDSEISHLEASLEQANRKLRARVPDPSPPPPSSPPQTKTAVYTCAFCRCTTIATYEVDPARALLYLGCPVCLGDNHTEKGDG